MTNPVFIIVIACIFSLVIFTSATCSSALLKNNYNYIQVQYFKSVKYNPYLRYACLHRKRIFSLMNYVDKVICPSYKEIHVLANRPFSLGGHVESQENKKVCFRTASLAHTRIQCKACRAKTNLFILLRLNMAAE